MKKEYRIKKTKEIENIMTSKMIAKSKNFIVFIKENQETTHFRYAISISKKNGNAVSRNHEKRIIRSIFQNFKNDIAKKDIFVIIRSDIRNLSYTEKESDIYTLLFRLKVIKERTIS